MTILEFKKLCILAAQNPLAARVKAYQTLPPDFIKNIRHIAKWSDKYIATWDRLNGAVEIKCPWGKFWLVSSANTQALPRQSVQLTAFDLRTLAQTLHPPF